MADVDPNLVCSMQTLAAHPDRFPFVIRECPGMGQGVFATEDIPAGTNLAYDPPLIYWEEDEPEGSPLAAKIIEACDGRIHTNVVNLLTVYCHASPETRRRVDAFMTIPPDAAHHIEEMTAVWQTLAEKIWHGVPEIRDIMASQDDIVHLYTRSHLNAHNFYTGHVMLEIGAKFNHACRPNATYNKYTTASGTEYMRIFTIHAVPAGQQIFSTYIGGTDMLKSTRDRRRQLAKAKAFVCRCDRCLSPDILSPLPCPSCRPLLSQSLTASKIERGDDGICLRHDDVEYPWRCATCGRRWWDAEITVRESQLRRLITHLDGEMTLAGRFPPVQIMRFVVRDALEDLGRGHYLAVQARGLLEELFAFVSFSSSSSSSSSLCEGSSDGEMQGGRRRKKKRTEGEGGRIANCWQIVEFLMTVVWEHVSPVVATNLSVLRIVTLLRETGPRGIPRRRLRRVLARAETLLRVFWGPDDPDAALCRRALDRELLCERESCRLPWRTRLVVCSSCLTHYCSRTCLLADREAHADDCRAAQETATILQSPLAF